jgi:Fur family transcriptional regulator, ferric uptake regulator
MRLTNQRLEIMEFINNNYTHPTVEDIYDNVRKKVTRISKATVYQNLKILVKEGIVREVNITGVSRFEPNLEAHHHLICKTCSTIIDFDSKELTEYSLRLAKRVKDMKIESTNTNFYGICKKCRGKKIK